MPESLNQINCNINYNLKFELRRCTLFPSRLDVLLSLHVWCPSTPCNWKISSNLPMKLVNTNKVLGHQPLHTLYTTKVNSHGMLLTGWLKLMASIAEMARSSRTNQHPINQTSCSPTTLVIRASATKTKMQ